MLIRREKVRLREKKRDEDRAEERGSAIEQKRF